MQFVAKLSIVAISALFEKLSTKVILILLSRAFNESFCFRRAFNESYFALLLSPLDIKT